MISFFFFFFEIIRKRKNEIKFDENHYCRQFYKGEEGWDVLPIFNNFSVDFRKLSRKLKNMRVNKFNKLMEYFSES